MVRWWWHAFCRDATGTATTRAGAPPPRPAGGGAGLLLTALLAVPFLLLATPGAAAERQARPGAAAASRRDPAALEAARRFLCPHGGTPVRGQRGRCRPGAGTGLADGAVRGWDAGLPPPRPDRQAACPPGTVAVAPVARSDARRCVPD